MRTQVAKGAATSRGKAKISADRQLPTPAAGPMPEEAAAELALAALRGAGLVVNQAGGGADIVIEVPGSDARVVFQVKTTGRASSSGDVREGSGAATETFLAALLAHVREGASDRLGDMRQRYGDQVMTTLNADEVARRMLGSLATHPLDEHGPYYRQADVARWLNETRANVSKKVKARSLLGAHDTAGNVYLPAWQFRDDRTPIRHLKPVLDALAAGTDESWTWVQWLATEDELTGEPHWRVLDSGSSDAKRVMAKARADAARWAS